MGKGLYPAIAEGYQEILLSWRGSREKAGLHLAFAKRKARPSSKRCGTLLRLATHRGLPPGDFFKILPEYQNPAKPNPLVQVFLLKPNHPGGREKSPPCPRK